MCIQTAPLGPSSTLGTSLRNTSAYVILYAQYVVFSIYNLFGFLLLLLLLLLLLQKAASALLECCNLLDSLHQDNLIINYINGLYISYFYVGC